MASQAMIQRVFEQAQLSAASRIVVATEDSVIFDCVSGFGGEVVMTSSDHKSGTDRAAEACNTLEISGRRHYCECSRETSH